LNHVVEQLRERHRTVENEAIHLLST
jgi:hypothetical protein